MEVVAACSPGSGARDDAQLIDRLVTSYRQRAETPTGLWAEIVERHADVHAALMADDQARVREILRNPATSDLMYGFESNARSLHHSRRLEDIYEPALALDALICLAEAIAARPADNPESYMWRPVRSCIEQVLSQVEASFGFPLLLPNPFARERGSVCSRGIVSYRVPHAIYQAWRISRLVTGIAHPRVLEIGGGLGRTALYARQFGITDYTIIDIPISSLAQGNFLGRVVGEDAICLSGEEGASPAKIKLLAPSSFLDRPDRYHVVLNVDSITEIGAAAAQQYWSAIQAKADVFLSINHEANPVLVAQLIKDTKGIAQYSRWPYWMRRGYVEEECRFAGC